MTNPDRRGLRDRVAELMGWSFIECEAECDSGATRMTQRWKRGDRVLGYLDHPITNDLNGAAAAFPNGWDWARWLHEGQRCWLAARFKATWLSGVQVPDTGDEITDRLNLAIACREAEGGSNGRTQ